MTDYDKAAASRSHSEYMHDKRVADRDRVRDATWARQDKKDRDRQETKDKLEATKGEQARAKLKQVEKSTVRKEKFAKEQTQSRQDFTDEMYEKRREDQLIDRKQQADLNLAAEKEKTRRSLAEIKTNTQSYKHKLDADHKHDVRTRKLNEEQYVFESDTDVDAHRQRLRAEDRNMRSEVKTRLRATLLEKIADHVLTKDMIRFQRGIDNRIESQSIDEIADKLDALDAAHDHHDRQSLNVEDKFQLRNITEQED